MQAQKVTFVQIEDMQFSLEYAKLTILPSITALETMRKQIELVPDSPIRDVWGYGAIVAFTDNDGEGLEVHWGDISPLFESLTDLLVSEN
jgi:hypothetical protein